MPAQPTPLEREFAADHRSVIGLLDELRQALEADDLEQARRIADRLDREAGAHIRFEERVLYPEVGRRRGRDFVATLLEEHRQGRHALRSLLQARSLTDDQKQQVLRGIDAMLRHAYTCGTLLSIVAELDAETQQRMLETLRSFRDTPIRWTQLPNDVSA